MGDEGKLLQVAQQLMGELQLLQMDLTVQRSAYLLLVRRCAHGRAALPGDLAADLERMGRAQGAPAWQALHSLLAGQLRLLRQTEPTSSTRAPCRRAL